MLLLLLLVLHDFEASMRGGKLIAFLGRLSMRAYSLRIDKKSRF